MEMTNLGCIRVLAPAASPVQVVSRPDAAISGGMPSVPTAPALAAPMAQPPPDPAAEGSAVMYWVPTWGGRHNERLQLFLNQAPGCAARCQAVSW